MTVAEMYLMTLPTEGTHFLRYNRLVFQDISDQQKLRLSCSPAELAEWNESDQSIWRFCNAFTFIQYNSHSQEQRKLEIMRHNLNMVFGEMFGVQGEVFFDKRKSLCLVRSGLPLRNGQRPSERIVVEQGRLTLEGVGTGRFASLIDQQCIMAPGLPVIDCTEYSGLLDLSIPWPFKNTDELNSSLSPYGLALVEQYASVLSIRIKQKAAPAGAATVFGKYG